MTKLRSGVDNINKRHPGFQNVKISSGLRGIRYFIEFPIVGRNVDAYSILENTKKLLAQG